MSSVLLIIGNGFDLFHCLPTGYSNYKSYLKNHYSELAMRFERFLKHKDIDKSNSWSNLEMLLTFDFEEYFVNVLNNNPLDLSADNPGWNDPEISVDAEMGFLKEFTGKTFLHWLDSIDLSLAKHNVVFPADCKFITFNYTTLLEARYGFRDDKVLHIHGIGGQLNKSSSLTTTGDLEIQFGSPYNNASILEKELEKKYKSDDYYGAWIQSGVSRVSEICAAAGKDLKKNYRLLSTFIESGDIKSVCIFGHSFSGVDSPYYKDIFVPMLKGIHWTFVIHSEVDRNKMAVFCANYGIEDYSMISSYKVENLDLSAV